MTATVSKIFFNVFSESELRITMSLSELLRAPRPLLPPLPFCRPCGCRAALRGR